MKLRKGVSPVVATVILVAVAITVAVAIAYWMGGLYVPPELDPRYFEVQLNISDGEFSRGFGSKYTFITFKGMNGDTYVFSCEDEVYFIRQDAWVNIDTIYFKPTACDDNLQCTVIWSWEAEPP